MAGTFTRDVRPAETDASDFDSVSFDPAGFVTTAPFASGLRPPLIGGFFDPAFFDPRLFHLSSGNGFTRSVAPAAAELLP